MEVDLVVMLTALLLEFFNRLLDVCTGERLCESKQNMVVIFEVGAQCKFKCHAEAFSPPSAAHISKYPLPVLALNGKSPLLNRQKVQVRKLEKDWLVPVTE